MSLLRPAKYFLTISTTLVLVSVVLLFVPGPVLSIDFTGGTLVEVSTPEEITKDALSAVLGTFPGETPLGNVAVSRTKDGSYLMRMRDLSNEEHLALFGHLERELGNITERQFTTIGPTVGASLKQRSIWALLIATIAIILYLAMVFRRVPGRLSPWSFGITAILALLHDTLLTLGIFTILSHTTSFQLDTLFVTALLSIMGYSVNDTIVIFDRIRSNLYEGGNRGENFAVLADRSLKETVSRTLNTGTGALIMLFVLFFFAAESIRWFILALIIGTVIGTYSSFFVATPILVYWRNRTRR
ncbi:protein-export membrane protein SecF [Candidatus Peribacteria bacterium RIFOXYC2_FULL_55_14]|nr:MAG: Protein translocase subunit SecF [Candidatus Peribacteria bacterium GW2011_GWB1_54_5]KKW44226.1 MAG: Protein translocase subunit SecF [Candidatus Peregrinibacteria bacterium GW2011_GWA2_54_9]OGJ71300.1 MAG: protein-export membrane protein SecF [Candidatus Peribacteria bacterium RIFOXYA1_FULL_56_14]OGJ74357.1 MAG: protein-export membrane protein SecF [Candidatus Peribacteria bacterium RIFOXYB1_FULL_54_35]OGJ75108.1 MAG: protein-export membrane protein SecF [Candidatus Peribacteria bacter